MLWCNTHAARAIPMFVRGPYDSADITPDAKISRVATIVSQSRDILQIDDFVIVGNPGDSVSTAPTDLRCFRGNIHALTLICISQQSESLIGQLREIVQLPAVFPNPPQTLVVVERFTVGGKHAQLNMPTLHRPQEPHMILCSPEVCSATTLC